jgi:hypothetical protein
MVGWHGRAGGRPGWPGCCVLVVLGLAATPWLDQLARQAGRTDLGSNATMVAYGLVAVSAATVGALLASRRPRHPVGWLLLALGLWFVYGYASWVLLAWQGAPPAVGLALLDANVMVIPALIGFVLLLTPTGSLPSPLVAAVPVALAVATLATQALTGNEVDLGWLVGLCLAVLPLAIGAAILRYRLYDLDRILSRTLAYGLLTVLLGGGYVGVVLGLGQLLGRDSSLIVAGATLAVWALFQPARRRIQAVVDRRFNRRRYDAAQTIERFSARLQQQVDLDTLTAELLAVVEETMQPTQASRWLRAASDSPSQAGPAANATDPAVSACMPCSVAPCRRSRSVARPQHNGRLGVTVTDHWRPLVTAAMARGWHGRRVRRCSYLTARAPRSSAA